MANKAKIRHTIAHMRHREYDLYRMAYGHKCHPLSCANKANYRHTLRLISAYLWRINALFLGILCMDVRMYHAHIDGENSPYCVAHMRYCSTWDT
jgi:hypothetical protein